MPVRKKATTTLTSKGQVTIPEAIREQLHLQTGDRLEWATTGRGTVEVRKVGRDWKELVGLLGRPDRSVSVEQMDVDLRQHLRRKHARR